MNTIEKWSGNVKESARDYISNKANKIEGWLHDVSKFIIPLLDTAQKKQNLNGDIIEIGIWHGKTFIFFNHLLDAGEVVHGYDLSIKKEFIENIHYYQKRTEGIGCKYSNCDSRDIDVNKLKESHSNIRMFHVDGYHTYEIAHNDLTIAIKTTGDKGIIMLDDFFSATVPGVTHAFFSLIGKSERSFFPFAIGGSKIFMCKKPLISYYRDFLFDYMPMKPSNGEDVDVLFGNKIAIYDLW